MKTAVVSGCRWCGLAIEVEVVNTHVWWVTVNDGDDVCLGDAAGTNKYGRHEP